MPGKGQARANPSRGFEGLPGELSQFLSKDTFSLLIKGESGTGKTILALTILKSLHPLENPLYLSTRTSPLQLLENYPWVEEILGPAEPEATGGSRESDGWETLVDARLDEPNVVFERITNVLMDKQAPTVVIDSWESLSDTLGSEALKTNIKVLQTWRERAGAKFIFVGEDPRNVSIDFMVEGVVELKDRVTEGRRFREIVLTKLHGVQIEKPSYFFTLRGGTFASIPRYSPRDYEFRNALPVRFDPPFRSAKGRVPTGYSSLDAHLGGGIPMKSAAVLGLDPGVDSRAGLIFLSRLVQGWLLSGGRVSIQRPGDVDRRFLVQYGKSFSAGKGTLQTGEDRGGDRAPRGKKENKRALAVLCGEKGGAPNAPGGERRVDLGVTMLREGSSKPAPGGRPSVYLRLRDLEGTLFLQCDQPSSALFAVVPTASGGNPIVRLEPVV